MSRKALVVVLGDLARSPRMQYHCISLAKDNYDVTVIANGGQSGDKSCRSLETNKNIKQLLMGSQVDFKRYLPSILVYIIKPIWQALLLIHQLLFTSLPDIILVQNPPSIPVLPIMYLYSCISRSRLVVDWHNYGFTIFSLSLGSSHPLVKVMMFIEVHFGRLADAGFCVSQAMKEDLIENHKINYPLRVLRDKPPSQFEPLNSYQRQEFLTYIQDQIPIFELFNSDEQTAIIMSSTSWTEDENFDILLNAMQRYEETLEKQGEGCKLPKLICVITGKGPLKSHYENKIAEYKFKHIKFLLPWLSADDYPKMVGSCDLGISLHSSSSGVDLPMKVVDFFGCGIPVLAYKYKAINELVIEDCYGLTFQDSEDLFIKLEQVLIDFNRNRRYDSQLGRYRRNIIDQFLMSRWENNWKQVAKPLLDKL